MKPYISRRRKRPYRCLWNGWFQFSARTGLQRARERSQRNQGYGFWLWIDKA